MIDMKKILRQSNYDVDNLIGVLEINEDRLYAWLVLDSPTVVRDDLDGSIEYVKALRQAIKTERPDYLSPYETELPI